MGWQDAPVVAPAQGARPKWMDAPVITGGPAGEPAGRRQHAEDMAFQQHPQMLPQPQGFDTRFPAEATAIGDAEYDRARTYGMPGVDTLPPKPAGYDERYPTTEAPTAMDQFTRGLRLGGQATGAGAADIAGMPVDLIDLGANATRWGIDQIVQMMGGPAQEHPYQSNPTGGSRSIRDTAAAGVEKAFGPDAIINPEDMTPEERVIYEANRFASANLIGSGLVSQFRNAVPRSLSAPYEASGSDGRVLLGDAFAGLGSGALTGAYHEYAPESMQSPIADLLLAIGGGVGGSKLAGAADSVTSGLRNVPDRMTTVPESIIPRDPKTMLPSKTSDVANAAALVQGKTYSPQDAAAEIQSYLDAAGPGANPTAGMISADPGLLSVERKMRATDPVPFIANDQAVMDAVSGKLTGVRPEGADALAPGAAAEAEIAKALGGAQDSVLRANQGVQGQEAALQALADSFSGTRSLDQASRDLDAAAVSDAYFRDRNLKNSLYDTAAADPNVVVRTDNVNAAADAALAENRMLNPALRDSRSTNLAEAFTSPGEAAPANPGMLPSTDAAAQPPVTRTLAEVMRDRAALSRTEAEARATGNYAGADTAASLRRGINADVRTAAESGVPGTEGLSAADAFYRNEFAPTYREGNVAPDFFRGVDKDSQRTTMLPEATASKFLVGGPASRAAAEDLSRVIARTSDPAAATAAATDYVLADAVRAGVIQNGKISENRLAQFMAAREGMFSQIPAIKQRFDDLLTGTRSGNAQMQQLTADLDKASQNLKLTEKQINEGALKLVAGADPKKAVDAVFASRNPTESMREATAAFAKDPQTADGWKAAVSDWMVAKMTTASKAGVSSDEFTVSLPKMRAAFKQNERALAEVFDPEEMQQLQQAYTRLEALSRRGTQASSGSATAENLGGLRGVITALANPAGTVTMLTRGALMAGSVERRIKVIAEQFPDGNMAANRLIERAMFDPKIMKHLQEFPTSDAQIYTWSAKLNELLGLTATQNRQEGEKQ